MKLRYILFATVLYLTACTQSNPACRCGEESEEIVDSAIVAEPVEAGPVVVEAEPELKIIVSKTPNLGAWDDKKDWPGMPYREGRVTVNDSTRYALVVFLHGANGGGTDNVKHHQNEHGHYQILDYWEKNRMKGIVLMPQCPIGQSWTNLQMKDKLKGLIEHYAAADSVDASRVYICGTSNGALGGWSMIQSYPNLFAGAMLAAAVPQGNSGGVPVCVVTGKHEGNQGNAMANLEAQKGVDVKYIYRPGWNHGQTCQQSFRETGCLDWLFEHRR